MIGAGHHSPQRHVDGPTVGAQPGDPVGRRGVATAVEADRADEADGGAGGGRAECRREAVEVEMRVQARIRRNGQALGVPDIRHRVDDPLDERIGERSAERKRDLRDASGSSHGRRRKLGQVMENQIWSFLVHDPRNP